MCYTRPIGLLCLPPLLNSQGLRRASLSVAIQSHKQPNCNLQAVFFAHGYYNLLFTTRNDKIQKKENEGKIIDTTHTPKHNSKVTGLVAKADKGSLRHPQKIFLFLLPKTKEVKTKRVFFGLPLHHCPPTCGHTSIMFRCISRCNLAGWWLVIYVYRSAGFHFYFPRHTGWLSIQLLWLSISISKLPF